MAGRTFNRESLPRRAVYDAIARGLPNWIAEEARTRGKEQPAVALDRASLLVLRPALDLLIACAHDLRLARVTVVNRDIALLVANSPAQIRYRLNRRIGPAAAPRYVPVETESGLFMVSPYYEYVDSKTFRLFVDLRVPDDRYGGLRSVRLTPELELPLTDELLDPEFRDSLARDARRLIGKAARYPGMASEIREFFERLRIMAWTLRDRLNRRRTRGYTVEVIRAGRVELLEVAVGGGGGPGARWATTAGATEGQMEDMRPDIPLLLEDLTLEEEEGIPAVIDDIRDVLDATRVSPEELHAFTQTVNDLLTLARGAALLVGNDLAARGLIADAAAWTEEQVAAAWNATDTGGFGSHEYLAQVRRRLGKDVYVPLILHARVAAIGRREITDATSEAERAVIQAAREGHALRMRAEPPPPLGEWMDGRLELIVRAAAALDLARSMEHPR